MKCYLRDVVPGVLHTFPKHRGASGTDKEIGKATGAVNPLMKSEMEGENKQTISMYRISNHNLDFALIGTVKCTNILPILIGVSFIIIMRSVIGRD